jgi:hypothetical protein
LGAAFPPPRGYLKGKDCRLRKRRRKGGNEKKEEEEESKPMFFCELHGCIAVSCHRHTHFPQQRLRLRTPNLKMHLLHIQVLPNQVTERETFIRIFSV